MSFPDLYRRAADKVALVLQGAKPATLPVEQPSTVELVVDLKTAKALGITIPQSIRVRIDRVIELNCRGGRMRASPQRKEASNLALARTAGSQALATAARHGVIGTGAGVSDSIQLDRRKDGASIPAWMSATTLIRRLTSPTSTGTVSRRRTLRRCSDDPWRIDRDGTERGSR